MGIESCANAGKQSDIGVRIRIRVSKNKLPWGLGASSHITNFYYSYMRAFIRLELVFCK